MKITKFDYYKKNKVFEKNTLFFSKNGYKILGNLIKINMNIQLRKLNEKSYYIEKLGKLFENLEVQVKDLESYLLAFIHRSLVNERPDFSKNHNERLEFL
jgi:hypothetical protein